jgi:translation initiation factor 2-alpha kinase 4
VASFDPAVLRSIGVSIVSELWANNISAELAVDTSSWEELQTRYKEDNHSWIVIVKQDSLERGLKIRSLLRKEDIDDLRSTELVSWIRNEIRSRNQREKSGEVPKLPKHPSQPESSTLGRTRDPDVRVLAHQKSKKTNRRFIIEQGEQLAPPHAPMPI